MSTIVMLVMIMSMSIFAMVFGPGGNAIIYPFSEADYNLLFQIRLPRIIGALIIGAGLATAGSVYQAAFKNPIVSPSILGVTSGAGIGAAVAMLIRRSDMIGPLSILCGCVTVYMVWYIAKLFSNRTEHLLVIGVIVSGVASSALALLKFIADPDGVLPSITYWLMGSLSSLRIHNFYELEGILLLCIIFYNYRWRLDLLTQPSNIVRSLGINEHTEVAKIIVGSTIIASLAASISGVIGMVGLAIPHLVRLLSSTDEYLPTMLHIQLTGAIFMLFVDTIIRMLPVELPVGILTSLFGALIFGTTLILRMRNRGRV